MGVFLYICFMKLIINIIAKFFKALLKAIQYALSLRIIRYVLLISFILYIGYVFGKNGKSELKQEIKLIKKFNNENQKIYEKQIADLRCSLDELAKRPTTQTIIKHVKVKDKATFSVNKPIKEQIDTNISQSEVKSIVLTKRQARRMKRFERKIQKILKKANK